MIWRGAAYCLIAATTIFVSSILTSTLSAAESDAPSETRIQEIRDLKSTTDISGVGFVTDQVMKCSRAAILNIKAASPSSVFEEGFKSAQEAMIWISERASDWGEWQSAHRPENRKKDWAKIWNGVAPCLQWIKVNFSYPAESGRTGSFSVIWPKLGAEADKLSRLTPAGVVDASLFDGSNEAAKIDIERWCSGGGSRTAPRFCMGTFVNLCQGYLYPRYAQKCDAVMNQRRPP